MSSSSLDDNNLIQLLEEKLASRRRGNETRRRDHLAELEQTSEASFKILKANHASRLKLLESHFVGSTGLLIEERAEAMMHLKEIESDMNGISHKIKELKPGLEDRYSNFKATADELLVDYGEFLNK